MSAVLSMNSVPDALIGRAEPRLSTPPLVTGPAGECGCGCALTPRTSRGFELVEFAAEVLNEPLLPWQRYLAIHALEQTALGLPRFRTVVVLVARQSGKTHLMKALALWRLFMDGAGLVLGVAQTLEISREAWQAGTQMAEASPYLAAEIEAVRRTNGDQELKLTTGGRWRIAAANRQAGRGLSVDLLLMDEIREQRTWDAWSALSKTTMARANAQTWCISNAGDDESVVLNHLRSTALGNDDPSIGIFEWSAPDGCDLDDHDAWAQSNPGLGHTITLQAIASALTTDPPEVFRTEVLCQHVTSLSTAIDMNAWQACADAEGVISKSGRVVVCIDVSPDLRHVTLAAAQTAADGRTRVAVAGAWDSTEEARRALPGLLAAIKPRAVAYFPNGPAAALAAELKDLKRSEPIKPGDVLAVCQGFAEVVTSRRLLHNADPLLTAHAASAQRIQVGDGWRFGRRDGQVDALYAAAGAVHVARSLPKAPSFEIISR